MIRSVKEEDGIIQECDGPNGDWVDRDGLPGKYYNS